MNTRSIVFSDKYEPGLPLFKGISDSIVVRYYNFQDMRVVDNELEINKDDIE